MRKYQTHMTGRRLRDALPQPQEYACLLTPDGFLARVSPDLERDFAPAAIGLHGQPFSTLVAEDDQVAVRAALSWIRDDGAPVVFECRWHHNDGSWRWLEWTVARRPGETVLVAVGRDVTRWREDEALALGQSRVLEQIVSNAPLGDILNAVCVTLEATSDRIRAAVHVVDHASNLLRLAAGSALDENLKNLLDTLALDDGPGAAVAAARRRELVVTEDLAGPTLWTGQREAPLVVGLRAEWALPVLSPTGDLLAVVAAYLTVPGEPLPRERQALGTAAELVRLALTSERRSHQSSLLGDALLSAGDVVMVLDAAGSAASRRVRWVNAAFERRLGLSRADVLGRTLDTLAGPDTDRTALDRIERALDSGLPVLQDFLAYGREGTAPIWLELDVSPVRDARHMTTGWVAVGRDITGPKLADEALARSEEHVQRALAAAGMATWEWDAERRALDCSETFGPLFGLPHGAAFATFAELLERTHPDDRDLLLQARQILFRGGQVREIQWRVLLPDGEVRWVQARMQSERERGWWLKRVAGVIGEAEEPEEAAGRQEESRVESPEPAQGTMPEGIKEEVGATVEQLLDLSSLVAEWSPSFRKFTVGAASLHLRLAPGLASVLGDAESLRVAVVELVKNAAEGLDASGGVISLATGTVEATRAFLASAYFDDGLPAGRYAYIEVSDTGRGMDAASVSRIFDPEFTTHGGGRGAGLPAVLSVVRSHHGAIQVYSKPDIGTTVRVLVPTEILVRSGRNGHRVIGEVQPVDVTRDKLVALTTALRATDLAS
jgi:PAS domain S-box-containing protein